MKNLFGGQQWRNRHREQTYGHGEREGENEMYGESNMETYITICKINSQWEFAVWLRKLISKPSLAGWEINNQATIYGIPIGCKAVV